MNDLARNSLAYFAIAAGLCAGAHWLVVEPRLRELGQAKSEAAQLTADLEAAKGLPRQLEALIAREQSIAAQAASIRALSEPATNESVLFSKVMALGQATSVRVDRLDAVRATAALPAGTNDSQARQPMIVRYSIAVQGTYPDIARFVNGLQRDLGYCRVNQVQLSPATEAAGVLATIETEHLAFDPSPLPASGQPIASGGPS